IRSRVSDLHEGRSTLQEVGSALRERIRSEPVPEEIADDIRRHYQALAERVGIEDVDVAVRSSATAEDLPTASFAGQHDSFLNVRGEQALIDACRDCFASLFNDRAISYREAQGFDHLAVALSVGVQQMVRSGDAGAGVMFTIETESGYPDVTVINAAWGLGESVVKGTVTPDEILVYTPFLDRADVSPIIARELGSKATRIVYDAVGGNRTVTVETSPEERGSWVLTDDEALQLARWGSEIERHYGTEMDIEWARDARDGLLYVVQARPETVASRRAAGEIRSHRLRGNGAV